MDTAAAAEALHELSKPRPGGEKVKVAIERAAKLAGLQYWRAFDIWYRKARRVEDFEATAIVEAVANKNARDARNELHDLRLRLNRLEAILSQTDPDFHRATIDIVGSQVRRSR
jgi:hypothetical protein